MGLSSILSSRNVLVVLLRLCSAYTHHYCFTMARMLLLVLFLAVGAFAMPQKDVAPAAPEAPAPEAAEAPVAKPKVPVVEEPITAVELPEANVETPEEKPEPKVPVVEEPITAVELPYMEWRSPYMVTIVPMVM